MIKKRLQYFVPVVPCLGILVYSLVYYRHSILFFFVVVFLLLLVSGFLISELYNNKITRTIKTTSVIFGITYLLLEVITYLLLGFGILRADVGFFFGGITASDSKIGLYDTISGYRAVPGKHRYLLIQNGKVQVDQTIVANSQGWFSSREYFFKKKSPRMKRYMVLGDSFSSGIVLATPWPDSVQSLLQKNGSDSVEIYNFSLDGAGIGNWYRTFFGEIIPQYEFDGIVIAASSEKCGIPDFDRKFIIGNSAENANSIQVIDITKESPPEIFPQDKAVLAGLICSNQELDRIRNTYESKNSFRHEFKFRPPDLYFLTMFYGITDGAFRMNKFIKNSSAYKKPFETYEALKAKPYKMEYFNNRYRFAFMLKKIIDYCKNNNKETVLITIPDMENVLDYVHGAEIIYRKEHRFLADHYNLKYFDGFEIFKGRDEFFVRKHFYEFDLHWNQKGASLFAEKFSASGILK